MSSDHGQALPVGYELDGYHIESVLGSGGFGITYRAREIEIKRTVAIKEYLPAGVAMRSGATASVRPISDGDTDTYEYGLDRFRGEAETLVQFDHPNIVRVFRYFSANNTAYLVMQYVEGDSLDAILKRDGTLPESEIREVLDPILAGLARVHAAGFLHRDIKPANIYIREDGSPVLLDFGAARLALGEKSMSLTAIVSGGYAPIEQYSSKVRQGPWTDIYAIGATLYRAVAGTAPTDAMDRMQDDDLVPARDIASGKYSATLLEAIDAALASSSADRPQSISAFRALIGAAALSHDEAPTLDQPRHEAAAPPPHSETVIVQAAAKAAPMDRPAKDGGLSSPMIALVTVVVGVLGAGAYWGLTMYQDSEAAREVAVRAQQRAQTELNRRKEEEARLKRAARERATQRAAQRRAAALRKAAERRRAAERARQAVARRETLVSCAGIRSAWLKCRSSTGVFYWTSSRTCGSEGGRCVKTTGARRNRTTSASATFVSCNRVRRRWIKCRTPNGMVFWTDRSKCLSSAGSCAR